MADPTVELLHGLTLLKKDINSYQASELVKKLDVNTVWWFDIVSLMCPPASSVVEF